MLDTLRYDSFKSYFQWLDGIEFTQAYSTSHWTVPVHASLFTGQYASNVGVTGQSPTLDCKEQTLAEDFQRAGFRTRCLSANAQLNQYDGWERGFDEFVRTPNLGRTDDHIFDWGRHIQTTTPGIRRNLSGVSRCIIEEVDTIRSLKYGYQLYRKPKYDGGLDAVCRRVASTDFGQDEFLFINLMETHTPYHPPLGEEKGVTVVIAEALAGMVDNPTQIREAYERSVRYLAREYRNLFQELSTEFDYVVTLSDHGELLGEYGLWNHSIGIHPELVRIPVVISGQGVEPEQRTEPVNVLDIHQTIASLADISVESMGRNLNESPESRELLVESHGLLPFHRDQFERYDVPIAEFERWTSPLFGFVDTDSSYCYEERPGELRYVGDGDKERLQARHEELRTTFDILETKEEAPDVSAEVQQRLEELGYA